MAGKNASISIAIVADASNAVRGFKETQNAAQRTSKTISAGAKIAALGFAAVGAASIVMAKNAAEDAAGARRLAVALQNTTGATKAQTDAVEEWIAKQGTQLGVSDDQLRPSLQRLAQATGDVAKAQKLAAVAMDVSAGSGQSLESVSKLIAKAQQGQVAGLAKLGVATKDASGKTLSFDQIMQNMSKTFGGQAAAAADSADGKLARFKLTIDEAQESIGYLLLPALSAVATILTANVIPAVNGTVTWLQEHKTIAVILAGSVAALGAAFIVTAGAMKVAAVAIALQTEGTAANLVVTKAAALATQVWAGVQWLLNAALTANPIGLLIVGIAALVAGIVIAYQKSDTFRAIVQGAWNGIKVAAEASWNFIRGALSQFGSALGQVGAFANGAWSAIRSAFDSIKNKVTSVVGDVWGAVSGLPGRISGAFSNVWHGVADGLKEAINAVLHLPLVIPKITLPVVGTIGGETLIQALANGGVTTGPTLALIGDNPGGREAVIPLDRYPNLLGGGDTVTVNVTVVAPVGSSPEDIGREIQSHLDAWIAVGGRRRAA